MPNIRHVNDDQLLTPAEVACAFNVDPKTVIVWADKGKIPYRRTPGNHRRFRASVVDAIMNGEPWEAIDGEVVGKTRTR